MAPTPAQSRIIDPILTGHARGYTNAEFIAHRIAPQVPVPARGMKRILFGKDDFRLMNTRRSPGASTKKVVFGREGEAIALNDDALDALVPRENMEEAAAVPQIDEASVAVNGVLRICDLGLEAETAAIVQNPANYAAGSKVALAGSDKWSDPASKPSEVVEDGKLAIAQRIGREPNQLTIGRQVFSWLKRNAAIKEQFKYTSSDSITEAMLAAYFDVDEVIVGRAVALPEGADDSALAQFLWGNFALLSYTNKDNSYRAPGFAFTYRLANYPIVEKPVWDRDTRSWVYGVSQSRAPLIAGSDAGFLITM